jgi:carbon monoxide dehydrogenase subunit G
MARFTASIDVQAPVERVWDRITDWPAHGRWIPLTTVWVTTDRPDGVGARFVGRTGIGPIAFDDPMEVVEWTPPVDGRPGYVRVEKHGRVVLGWAGFEVAPGPGAGSRVRWTEDAQVVPVRLTRPASRLIEIGARFGLHRVLRAMADEIEGEVRPVG